MFTWCIVFSLVVIATATRQDIEITPKQAVRLHGDRLIVLCKVPYPIRSCRMTVGTESHYLHPDKRQGHVTYTGRGLHRGECGAFINNLKQEWSGNISCAMSPNAGGPEAGANMSLVVIDASSVPRLIAPTRTTFREGDLFTSQCVVSAKSSKENISWYLGNEVLIAGVQRPTVFHERGRVTVTQNIARNLTVDDNGKLLMCRTNNVASEKNAQATRRLVVLFAPRAVDSMRQITVFGVKVGHACRVTVSVRANPRPAAQWRIARERLMAPQSSADSGRAALAPTALHHDTYNMTLFLSSVSRKDLERPIYLRVSNELGSAEITVSLSVNGEDAPTAAARFRVHIHSGSGDNDDASAYWLILIPVLIGISLLRRWLTNLLAEACVACCCRCCPDEEPSAAPAGPPHKPQTVIVSEGGIRVPLSS